jgi:hypothetical protein
VPGKRKSSDRNYEVGFGKPPAFSRFRKGESGNPSGRPKKKKTLATVLEQELQKEILIKSKGRKRRVTRLEAAVCQMSERAAGGDLNAFKLLCALVQSVRAASVPSEQEANVIGQEDQKVLEGILQRLRDSLEVKNAH